MKHFTLVDVAELEQSEDITFDKYLYPPFNQRQIKCLNVLLKNIYSFSTINMYSLQQKQLLLNQTMQLIQQVPNLLTSKADYSNNFENSIEKLYHRNSNSLTPLFTYDEVQDIKKLLKTQILVYYEIYQFVLDTNEDFSLSCELYQPIPKSSEPQIYEGQVVDVESVQMLKDYVGERAPKQQKKDPKKK